MGAKSGHLGGIGEAALKQWCHEADITPNRVEFDNKGWDFFLQFPSKDAGSNGGPAMSCLVQVKATQGKRRRVSVTLANWRHLATTPLPAFFLIIELDAARKPKRAFLVHLDEPRGLECLAPGRKKPIPLTWAESDALSAMNGGALGRAVMRHVVPTMAEYVAQKLAWPTRIVPKMQPGELTVTMPALTGDEVADLMADFAIGVAKDLRPASVVVRRQTTDGRSEVKTLDSPTLSLPSLPSFGTTVLVLRNARTGDEVRLDAETHVAAAIFPNLPEAFRKIRFVAGPISVVVAPDRSDSDRMVLNWSIKIPREGRVLLSEFVAPARAMRLLATASDGDLWLAYKRGDLESDAPVFAGALRLDEEAIKFARTIDNAWSVASLFGLPATTEVDLEELEREHDRMSMLRLPVIVGDRSDAEVSVTLPPETRSDDGKPVAILLNPSTRIGDHILSGVLAVCGQPRWAEVEGGRRMTVSDPHPRLMAKRVLTLRDWKRFDSYVLFDQAETALKREGIESVFRPDKRTKRRAARRPRAKRSKASTSNR